MVPKWFGAKWFLSGAKWFLSGFKWFQVALSGFKWFQVVSSGFKWLKWAFLVFSDLFLVKQESDYLSLNL